MQKYKSNFKMANQESKQVLPYLDKSGQSTIVILIFVPPLRDEI
jgi:hypothetical protein